MILTSWKHSVCLSVCEDSALEGSNTGRIHFCLHRTLGTSAPRGLLLVLRCSSWGSGTPWDGPGTEQRADSSPIPQFPLQCLSCCTRGPPRAGLGSLCMRARVLGYRMSVESSVLFTGASTFSPCRSDLDNFLCPNRQGGPQTLASSLLPFIANSPPGLFSPFCKPRSGKGESEV